MYKVVLAAKNEQQLRDVAKQLDEQGMRVCVCVGVDSVLNEQQLRDAAT